MEVPDRQLDMWGIRIANRMNLEIPFLKVVVRDIFQNLAVVTRMEKVLVAKITKSPSRVIEMLLRMAAPFAAHEGASHMLCHR